MFGTREDETVIVSGIEKFEFATLLFFWQEVLFSINRIHECLQNKETTFY
jgi:hypothetical protein